MKRDKPRNASMIDFLNAKNLPVTLAIIVMLLSITPALFAQRDVHASLIVPADRKPAPLFHLTAETGRSARISDYRGKVILLNFWATDCGGCVLEIPSIIDVEAAYKNKGFTVVGISMDIPYENAAAPTYLARFHFRRSAQAGFDPRVEIGTTIANQPLTGLEMTRPFAC